MKQKKQPLQQVNSIDQEIERKLQNQKAQEEKELDPYKIDRLSQMPMWILITILKWWFGGAVFYLAWMGLFIISNDGSTETIVGGVILGAVIDILLNRIIRFMERGESNDKYIFVTTKKYYSFILNILYGLFISFFITYVIGIPVTLIARTFGYEGVIALEPISFGLCYVLLDFVLIKLKRLFKKKKNI